MQTVGYSAMPPGPSGGSFTLTFDGQTTALIAYNASAAAVQAALEGLSNIGAGDVSVAKTSDVPYDQRWQITFTGNLADQNVAQITIDTSGIQGTGLSEVETTDTEGGTQTNEKQTVTLSNATGGTFRLAFEGYVTAMSRAPRPARWSGRSIILSIRGTG